MVSGFSVEANGQECDRAESNPSGEPRHRLLREHSACREVLGELHALGVREFRFALRYLDGSSVDSLFDRTWFAKGVRVTGRRESTARSLQVRLSIFVEDAINESLLETDAEGSDLFVIVYGGLHGDRQQWELTAGVTAITNDPYFTDRAIELM
jgi:hypothetical protein